MFPDSFHKKKLFAEERQLTARQIVDQLKLFKVLELSHQAQHYNYLHLIVEYGKPLII